MANARSSRLRRSISPPLKRKRFDEDEFTQSPIKTAKIGVAKLKLVLYSWNINGITPFIQKSITSFFGVEKLAQGEQVRPLPRASLRTFLKRHDWPTLLFLQEVKIKPGDSATIQAVKTVVKSGIATKESGDEPDYEAHFCLPSDQYHARGYGRKIYGVCSIIRSDFAKHIERIRTVDWDLEGRVLVIEMKQTSFMPRLAIFNIYAVNGTTAPYKNSTTGQVVGTRHDRKLLFHELLAQECRMLESRGSAVILAGDMNVARSTLDGHPNLRAVPHQHCINRADFESKFFVPGRRLTLSVTETSDSKSVGLGMVDTFRYLHPTKKGYTYYPHTKVFGQSCDRVDMIMTSSVLQQNIVDAGMHETPMERGTSDHVPLFATFSFEPTATSCTSQT